MRCLAFAYSYLETLSCHSLNYERGLLERVGEKYCLGVLKDDKTAFWFLFLEMSLSFKSQHSCKSKEISSFSLNKSHIGKQDFSLGDREKNK